MCLSAFAAADENGKKVIGVDVDQSGQSETVITSAMKGLREGTMYALGKYFDGKWSDVADKAANLGAAEDAVGLPTDTWSLKNFSVEQYEELLGKIKSGVPLSDGNGSYQVKVFRNTTGNKYANVLSETFQVSLDDEFAPFLRPNQYVNYENATETMNKAALLVAGKSDLLEKVEAVYSFVVNNISYDYEEAATVQSGYLPDLDEVLRTRKGICFDYAALMTGMLRSQGIACKLVVGYAGSSYHAWISVWSPDSGWISGAIFFNGIEWQLMDPTFVSTGGPDATTGVTYTSKYIY